MLANKTSAIKRARILENIECSMTPLNITVLRLEPLLDTY
jgi:hypothetical protein